MDPRNNSHVSLFSFSWLPPLTTQNCFLHRVSLTYFPSRSPIRGYLNLLTPGLYPRDRLPIRACRWFPFPVHPFSLPPQTGDELYKSARTCVLSLSPVFSYSSSPGPFPPTVTVLHFHYILLRPREMSLLFFLSEITVTRDVGINNWNVRP